MTTATRIHFGDSFELREKLFFMHRQCQALRFAFLCALMSTVCAVAGFLIHYNQMSPLWLGLAALGTLVWICAAVLFYVMPSLQELNQRAEEESENH
ncbi:hypothetical protein GCM10023213_14260 [Prosthecobacter algae]|uniref:Uncharacterized protein n=1 Tax=Prosthecobacter algae TaxID=1144682 RepID=A0ABP9P0Z9_9BACT